MLTNTSFDLCTLGQFSAAQQTPFDNTNVVILSIWEGSLLSEEEIQKIHNSNFNISPIYHQYDGYYIKDVNSYEGQWIKSTNPNVGLVGMGRRELVRCVFNNFTNKALGNTIYERIFQFSKDQGQIKAKASGTAQMFSLCIVNQDIDASAAVNANNRANFLIFGSCGDFNSDADLKLSSVNILQDSSVRIADMRFEFDLFSSIELIDPVIPVYEYREIIPSMTGYSNSVATITASGEYDPSTYPAWKAFQRNGLQNYYLATPNMSNGIPSGFNVTSSGNYNSNYLPSRLFNSVDATTGQDGWFSQYPGSAPTDLNPHWAQIEYPAPVRIDAYVIQNSADPEIVKALKGGLLASNDGINWATLDTWEYTAASAVSLGLRPIRLISSPAKYKFYRLAIYKTNEATHNGVFLNYVSIPRLYLLSKEVNEYQTNPRMFTITSTLNTDSWLSELRAASEANPYWLKVEFAVAKVVTAYRIWNGDKPHMLSGSVQASNDNQNWTTLDSIDLQTVPTNYTWRNLVELNNSVAYKYYRLNIVRISEWSAVCVGEWVLFESILVE
jgi:hypothetical protein